MSNTEAPSKPKRREPIIYPDMQKADDISPINLGMGETAFNPPPPLITTVEKPMPISWNDEIQWMEGPVKVTVTSAGGDHAPLYVSAHCNGLPLEQWFDGIGWIGVRDIPVNEPVIIKRKYAEILIRARTLVLATEDDRADGTEPRNILRRKAVPTVYVTILRNDDPPSKPGYAKEWEKRLHRLTA